MNLVNYVIATSPELPPIAAQLYEYIFAANGVFIRAKRSFMEAMWAIGECEIRGLAEVEAYLRWEGKQIPFYFLNQMLVDAQNTDNEVLWYLWQEDNWLISKPEQSASTHSVTPVYPSLVNTDYEKAMVEVHSHGDMRPFFSKQDDADEQGFRIYAVLGSVRSRPAISVRIGLAGYFCPIPAYMVFGDFVDNNLIEDTYEH
ncbi:MAG: Mov34/MPN/PAD-1 family protein [Nostoc sp. SerVER01]|nr:Mov34/MPN/PAD-1 family protein [Nostoc sp. SerVER01]